MFKYFFVFLVVTATHIEAMTIKDLLTRRDPICDRTSLHWAVAKGDREAVLKLIRLGADVDAEDRHGDTPLHLAAQGENTIIVLMLIDADAMVDKQDRIGSTPLHEAVLYGRIQAIKYLLEAKAAKDIKDEEGKIPLDYAREKGNAEIEALLTSQQ